MHKWHPTSEFKYTAWYFGVLPVVFALDDHFYDAAALQYSCLPAAHGFAHRLSLNTKHGLYLVFIFQQNNNRCRCFCLCIWQTTSSIKDSCCSLRSCQCCERCLISSNQFSAPQLWFQLEGRFKEMSVMKVYSSTDPTSDATSNLKSD